MSEARKELRVAQAPTMHTGAIRSALINILGVALALASGSALATTFRLIDLGPSFGGGAFNASGQVMGGRVVCLDEYTRKSPRPPG